MKLPHQIRRRFHQAPANGFTLLEVLIVVFIIAILAALGIPSWLNWVNTLRLNSSQNQIYSALRQAQSQATSNKDIYQVSFREMDDMAQWAVHLSSATLTDQDWQNFNSFIKIDETKTTFYQYASTGVWRMQFNQKGHANGRLGRVTVRLRNSNSNKQRCVFVSTLLGAMRKTEKCG
ncbi:prepilin-type N-terminal cleavage/methylation domain-containing protein [Oscillatoria acuminata PCC 6304]|uniref:Prepilin-type N-terminal cleavage/methylation domain-containing protein n=2 Tax=Oscillatoria acuminata TaxID=118323 RepID=K9TET1_9CYAN|nr:prepilin-type N-terminal cleavage/methylation domain-containing protein [Oscillatoria acuminata PCC 6304]